MSLTDDLYREIILDHFRAPRNHGKLERPDITLQGTNPLCGDEVELTIALEKDTIRDVRILGKGCSISQASGSMMTEIIKGKRLDEAKRLSGIFKEMMLGDGVVEVPDDLEELEALEGVKKYPVRIKCALLAWNTLLGGIDPSFQSGGS